MTAAEGGGSRGFDDDIMLVAMMKRFWNVGSEGRRGVVAVVVRQMTKRRTCTSDDTQSLTL